MRYHLILVKRRILTFLLSRILRGLSGIHSGGADDTFRALAPSWKWLVSNQERLSPQVNHDLRAYSRSLFLKLLPAEALDLIPSLEKRDTSVLNTWEYQNNVMNWDIKPDELVLDIGCGGWPFKRANHLADKFPEQTTHRVEALARDDRPFFEVDLERLPFAKLSYDFVFCSHVLEHLDNPGQAIRELTRIGSRGYIEVPTRLSDVLFNFTRLPDHHRWHGMVQGDTLVLVEWNEWERHDLGNHYFNSLQSEYHNPFQDFFEHNRELFFASYHWSGSVDFLIIDKLGEIIDSSRDRL